ncbi:NADH-quinone oxidoreductase subunit N [Calderihabitans maritimus]|uniref:NADH-quinone oxidoreductase subunit N n=1 Tax=Calderihabitans maritimus TaxID=1246530 RepID=A0A1Z5HXW2_9FIRM|nr:NADH-quinone oxidoreductase subunit N [Calderihabitans maritimus]GAW94181.1 NADH-quinone oxidoreductase subunit N [Calderihabitans maritimus]
MNWWLLTPEIIITVTALLVLVLDFMLPESNRREGLGTVGVLGLVVALLASFRLLGVEDNLFNGVFVVDRLAVAFKIIFISGALLVYLLIISSLERLPGRRGEFFWLVLTALLGMMVTAASRELVTIYVGIELISLSFYALVGYRRDDKNATEAALKYFILGSFAIGLWLYGAALVYGLTGQTDLIEIAKMVDSGSSPLLLIGLFLLIVGFGFKMGLAPFHMWVPDAYQEAPTPVTAFLAVGSKAAAFAVFVRVMLTGFHSLAATWAPWIGFAAAVTMTWGNAAALRQTNIKRMLAYSGVAHAGYALVGVASASAVGSQAVTFYLFAYLFATLGAFAVVVAFSNLTGSDLISDYAGLHWRNPFLALGLTLCLLSLAGIPPLAGFFGKFYLFWGAIQQGGWLLVLVIIAAINSAISLYYYVNVIRVMYFIQPSVEQPVTSPLLVNITLVVALAGIALAAFYFQPVLAGIELAGL